LAIVNFLVEKGADTELSDAGSTPLLVACSAGDMDIAKSLIKYGANLEARDNEGYTSFLQAVLEGHAEMVKFLLRAGADKHVANYVNQTAIQLAQKNEDFRLVDLLKNIGAS
jgi:ankyrin repeat protein